MSGVPGKVWLDWPGANRGEPVFDHAPENEFQAGQTCFIRADLSDAAIRKAREEGRAEGLREAAAAWEAFKGATISDDHFAAVERLDAIFALIPGGQS